MNGPRGYHTEWNKSGREGQILYDITYMWNLKIKQTNIYGKIETDSDIGNKLVVTNGEREGEWKRYG